jgi:hypothetical protein
MGIFSSSGRGFVGSIVKNVKFSSAASLPVTFALSFDFFFSFAFSCLSFHQSGA